MTHDPPPDRGHAPGPTPENMVSYSEQLLNHAIARLTRLLARCDDMPDQAAKELADEFRSLRKAVEIAYHERAGLQKLKAAEGGGSGGGALNLGAARSEIARRLACLRAADDSGGIPGQPE